VVIALSLAATLVLLGLGRRRRAARLHAWMPRALGVTILAGETTFCLYPVYLGTFRPDWALPLQLCDITAFATGLGLVTGSALALEIAYFLGLSGTLLTTFSPDLLHDFPHVEFFCFFATHALVSVAAAYVVFGLDRRPRPAAALRVFAWVNAYGLAISAVNWLLGANYLYICRKPPVASPFDYMGPWPCYVGVLDLTLLAFLAGLTYLARQVPLAGPGSSRPGRDGSPGPE
jgi:hypothetical integral membrane protein (TIGR02206 family)